MKPLLRSAVSRVCVIAAILTAWSTLATGQETAPAPEAAGTTRLDAIEVTGSRIRKAEAETETPVLSLTREDLEASGISSVGDILQRLSVSSSALNTKFNSAGNFGFPADGGGVGSGSTTVSLRNLGAKRVLVLVDGLRWVNESSASGVSAAVDLNTIPVSIIDRVEVLTDGASALYGSDAIAGVVNIITRKKLEGTRWRTYAADYSTGDGSTAAGSLSLGGAVGGRSDFFIDLSYFNQNAISSGAWEQSRFPVPGTGVAFGSSATPNTRSVFIDPANDTQAGLCPLEDLNNDGVAETAVCDVTRNNTATQPVPVFPNEFHQFDGSSPTGDRFNFSPFNLLLTPNERTGIFSQVRHELAFGLDLYLRGLFQRRESRNQAAPEPIFIGPGTGSGGLADTISVDVTNPFNPFGYTLDAGSNFIFAGRRPLEGGPRIFQQRVNTFQLAGGLQGNFGLAARTFFWDLNLIHGRNDAEQTVQGTYNIARIKRALGPLAECTAPCVPLNFFGGPGTITQEMLDYISFVEFDRSEQKIEGWSANISGNLLTLPTGSLDFATGFETRRLFAAYSPDSVVTAGETNGVPSLPTSGGYTVDEVYGELSIPVAREVPGIRELELSLASRYSDYSTFGSTTNSKLGLRWQITEDWTARATFAEGFRAPSVGELFGSPSRFDATLEDPCSGATDPAIVANCSALGVPGGFTQSNTQISVRTGGNPNLEPETADSFTTGLLYSPEWAENVAWASRLDFELVFYRHELDDAIQAIDAQTQLDRCVETLDPAFCDGITRGTTGDINGFDNTLRNLGTIETSGYDFIVDWVGPTLPVGRFGVNWTSTYVDEYEAISRATGLAEPLAPGIEVNDSSIPRLRSNLRLGWTGGFLEGGWTMRYISELREQCSASRAALGVCSDPARGINKLDATVYHDVRLLYRMPGADATLAVGVNNVLDEDPPVCLTCSLNGYDASTYDLPGTFAYVEATLRY